MHKYAALTALGIALITMVALTVSASLTPANAQRFCVSGSPDTARLWADRRGISVPLALEEYCFCQCAKDSNRRINTETPTSQRTKSMACYAKCVNAFEAARR
jgi:hypothetical protein